MKGYPGMNLPPIFESIGKITALLDAKRRENCDLRDLIYRLFDGIDEYWQTLPENVATFEEAKRIHDEEAERKGGTR